MSLRWQQRPDEVKRIDTYNQQQKSLLLRSPGKPKHDPALRQKFRVDPPDGTTPPGKPAQNAAAGSSNYASLRAPSLTSRGRASSLQGID